MPKILIVDDDEVDREAARRCLESIEDLEVHYARDGLEALERLAESPPHLILTDLRMPRMDGLELVERLRADDGTVPVVLMTASGSEQIAVRALQSGAASYVPKSDMKADLLDVTQRMLEISEARLSRKRVLLYLGQRETRFELENDPALISPLAAYFQEGLEHLGFADGTVRTQVGIAVMESVSNAMVHGNLEVASDLRRKDKDAYVREIARRRREMPWSGRRVRCRARESTGEVEYVIQDEGPGFDPSSLPDPTAPESMHGVSGRGVWLIRTLMDQVRFNEAGTEITILKRAPAAAP
jgi:CheY-like chemotaxis protein/anti-sigma regulatory factor (Ser/Thr protein kinase)